MSTKQTTFGPYSPIRQAGEMFFISGQVGVDMATKLAQEDVRAQTAKVLDNMAAVLAAEGLSLKDVVKTTIFVTDMSDFAAVNEVYMQRFPEPRPARSTVAVKELPRIATNCPVVVEMEAIAVRQKG